MLLETQNLSIGYEGKTLVQHIRFTLEENQICCLLGANGAGKSTFLKTLLGLQPPIGGEIFGKENHFLIIHQQNWLVILLMCHKRILIYFLF